MRATKIVATLGPSTDSCVEALVKQGVDVFRVNFSHGEHAEHGRRIQEIREAAEKVGRFVAIMADLQGPKIRISGFADRTSVMLQQGADFCLDTNLGSKAGDETMVGTTYPNLANEVDAGDILVLGDGLIELEVVRCEGQKVHCRVHVSGELGASKGINKRGGGLSAPALTDKDRADLTFACAAGVDYIAVSFPRSAADIDEAKRLVEAEGASCGIIAKIERAEAVADNMVLDDLIRSSDAVMVARGDLGIEIGDAALMAVQKRLITRARELNRSVITATQMMESMITNPRPTRAEVMDVANAVIDGTDAVMLSGETAVGKYPLETVASMVSVIEGAESSSMADQIAATDPYCTRIDASVAMAAMMVAKYLSGVRAVICYTSSGNTPRLMSQTRSKLPVYALADNLRTLARVALYRGVHPILFVTDHLEANAVNLSALDLLRRDGVVEAKDRVILSRGDYRNVQGGTNTMKILEVPDA